MEKAIMRKMFLVAAMLGFLWPACAEESFPRDSAVGRPDPVACPQAYTGGEITEYLGPSPKSLNYYLDNNMMSARVFDALYESLIGMAQTLEYDRGLACHGPSEDKKTFTFWRSEALERR